MDHATLRDPRLLAELYARMDGSDDLEALLAREVARYPGLLARGLGAVQLGPVGCRPSMPPPAGRGGRPVALRARDLRTFASPPCCLT